MKLSRLDLEETLAVDKERSHMIERIIHLTLDMLYLLTGEDYIVLKMSFGRVTHSSSPCVSGGFGRPQTSTIKVPPSSVTPERNDDKKVLEVINKIIELLTGEEGRRSPMEGRFTSTPIKQEIEDILSSEGESSDKTTPERCPCPLYSPDKEEGLTYNNKPKGDTAQNDREEVTTDSHTGWRPDKFSSSSVVRLEESGDDSAGDSEYKKDELWHLPKVSAQLATTQNEEEEDIGENPSMDSDWVTPTDGSLHHISSDGPGVSQDDASEETIVKVSIEDVQEVAELGDRNFYLNGKSKTFTCLDCRMCFASLEQLESHHKVHTVDSPFFCIACGNSFASSEELREHLKVHTLEKLFACSQCGKCFTTKANLITHRRMHTGNRQPFACAECGRRFTLRSSLEAHLPLHTIKKPYPCGLCGKCFTTSEQLTVHQMTHTGDKNYSCEDCGKFFTTSSSMNRHRRTHTGEKPYSCMGCGKCFNRKTNLYRHQMIHTR